MYFFTYLESWKKLQIKLKKDKTDKDNDRTEKMFNHLKIMCHLQL